MARQLSKKDQALESNLLTSMMQKYKETIQPAKEEFTFFNNNFDGSIATFDLQKKIREAHINVLTRDFIKSYGFDSIKYRNKFEGATGVTDGEEDFSYISFEPSQFKIITANDFNFEDDRVFKNTGGQALNALKRGQYQKGSEVRRDGTTKSMTGYLGPIENKVSGGTMTEFATDMQYKGKSIDVPTMVPTQSKEAIAYMQNMEPGKGWNMKDPMAKEIINKAREHAGRRLEQGKSPFYQDGE
jgi:hypothetical protein